MVKAQGGDVRAVDDVSRLPRAKVSLDVLALRAGYVTRIDAHALGVLGIELGAGRTRADQKLDPGAGFELHCRVGERIARGAKLITIHAATKALASRVQKRVASTFELGRVPPRARQLVLARIR
jgi:pyrimidine-nucleoside phosphorylase